eukprot:UN12113
MSQQKDELESKLKESQEEMLCIGCSTKEREVVHPCGHFAYCWTCVNTNVKDMFGYVNCPACRSVDHVVDCFTLYRTAC